MPTDDLFVNQWHLYNTGQFGGTPGIDINVVGAWEDYTGAGVTVGVYDSGVQYDHPDLVANYDASLGVEIDDALHDAFPFTAFWEEAHGTNVAGLIGAANDGAGTVGVAYGAHLAGIEIFSLTNYQLLQALYQMSNFDVVNHSWGYTTPFDDNILATGNDLWLSFFPTLQHAVHRGRDGLGTIIVHSAGNDRTDEFNSGAARDTNDSSFTNSRFVISVAATDINGYVTHYSTPGAAVFVSAPSGGADGLEGLWTTDFTGADGFNSGDGTDRDSSDDATPDYDAIMNGTSGASPIVAGVVALMLEANKELGWRDVQEILAYSAVHVGTAVGAGHAGDGTGAGQWELYDWGFNGAGNWNGGGLHFSNDYGYGMVNALAAVRLAETWTEQSTYANESAVRYEEPVTLAVPDGDPDGVSFVIHNSADFDIERVELEIDWDGSHPYVGDLVITLTSPSGLTSYLLNRDGTAFNTTEGNGQQLGDWVFTSNAFRGESGVGDWTISVADAMAPDSGTISNFKLNLWGQTAKADDTYIYTREYGSYAGDFGHSTTLTDTDGGIDTVNAAAVVPASTIDLHEGVTGSIAGKDFVIADGTTIENAIGGDGGDTMIGNGLDNSIRGMRGADTLTGNEGADTLDGGAGADVAIYGGNWLSYTFTKTGSAYTIADRVGTGEGTDQVSNVEVFELDGVAVAAADAINVAPVAVSDSYSGVAVVEAGAGGAGHANAVGNLLTGAGADSDANSVLGDTIKVGTIRAGNSGSFGSVGSGTQITGKYGMLQIRPDGSYTFTLNNSDADTQALKTGQTAYEVFSYQASDISGAVSNAATLTLAISGRNDAPVISSNDGGSTAAIAFSENRVAVADVNASDADSTTLTYSVVGTDKALFTINAATGLLSFKAAPDFEAPKDSDHDNVYKIMVVASDGAASDSQALTITVKNVVGNTITGTGAGQKIDSTHGIGGRFATGEDDRINGGGGNDTIDGGAGSDTLTGGSGADHFVFATALATAGIDRIVDFAAGSDRIDLKGSIFAGLGSSITTDEIRIVTSGHAAASGDHLVYNKSDGTLWYDANGVAGGEVEIAVFSARPATLSHVDFALV